MATEFLTLHGSVYRLGPTGKTIRNKAYRQEHGLSEQGVQPESEMTFYVDKPGLDALGEFQAHSGYRKRIACLPDGRCGVQYIDGPHAGMLERRTVVSVLAQPAVGLYPIELWNEGRTVHFGNVIAEVRP